ncbi:MAG: hypothetical protein RIR18_609, partial [Pseudomonadota bacterium]
MITCKIDGAIGTIILDNQAKRNALSERLVYELIGALGECAALNIRCVVLRAAPGSKIWSAGHDVSELPAGGHDPLGWQDPLRHLIRQIEDFPAPIIAMVDGSVWGGACETVLACDIIVSTPEATFAATPAKHSVPYNVSGLLTFLNTLPLHVAKEMLFTAQPIAAARLAEMGIVNHVVDIESIEEKTYEIAASIVKNAPLSITVMKEQLKILAGAHTMSPQDFERIQGLRRVVYSSEDYAEG